MAALLVNNSNSDSDPQIIFHTQLKACMHLTISLISHSSKVILNKLKPQAEDWLVGCFEFNGPFRQYFSLYRAVSQRGRKKEKDR